MKYQIICDSCGDFTPEMKADPHFRMVPLSLEIGEYRIMDDEAFDQADFIKRMAASSIGAKTACPSPEAFQKAIEESDADEVYIVTLPTSFPEPIRQPKSALISIRSPMKILPRRFICLTPSPLPPVSASFAWIFENVRKPVSVLWK